MNFTEKAKSNNYHFCLKVAAVWTTSFCFWVNQHQDGKVHIPVVFRDDRPQEIAAVDPEGSFSDAAIRRGED